MPRVSNIEVLKQTEQHTLIVKAVTKIEDLAMLIGQSYGKIFEYLKEMNELMTDVPFVSYHNFDMQNLQVEIGFPVSTELPGRDDVVPGKIPEGKAAFCMYRGSYNDMGEVYNEMSAWIDNNGYIVDGVVYEYYFNGPEFPESEYLTKIVMPLRP